MGVFSERRRVYVISVPLSKDVAVEDGHYEYWDYDCVILKGNYCINLANGS